MKEHNEIFIVQAPPASEVQPGGEQDAIQTEEDTIDNPGSAFPTSSEDSHDDSAGPCGEQDLLSRRMEHLKQRSQDCLEEDSLTAGQNETSALQIPLTSEIQPGEQDANQSEEHTVHNPRSTSPSGSEDSSDDYEELCEEQDLLTRRMEHLRQRDQEGEEDSTAFDSGEKENMKVPQGNDAAQLWHPAVGNRFRTPCRMDI
ncbi:uncharacterized protein LOC129327729 [Eublepharis macularius]|uniref:Uncharacterized protein LOC129327729 n=1 Tax=Eublepharis macularius TaxID=481883 RepID=A0AA97J7P9_EUBMA|nr:uncharacterized protein LOC129327729 [Eublepharis macularius]